MQKTECYDCGKEVPVAIWDNAVLAGAIEVVCADCDSPEFNLWNLSVLEEKLEEGSTSLEDDVFENIPEGDDDLAPEGEEYKIRENDKEPSEKYKYEIYVTDPEDEEQVEKARDMVKMYRDDY